MKRFLSRLVLLVLLPPCPACAHVAAYERGSLAHPTMTSSDIASPSEEHVRAVQVSALVSVR